jgi:Pyruvate/2-oxoacid:ferredoxin oxidoreductase gamma subunit
LAQLEGEVESLQQKLKQNVPPLIAKRNKKAIEEKMARIEEIKAKMI